MGIGMGIGMGGSIPACAGEPHSALYANCTRRVYPRVCGGARGGHLSRRARQGLSPRVRGSLVLQYEPTRVGGSIPACAGEPRRGM